MTGFAGVPAIRRVSECRAPRNPIPTPRCHKGAAVDVYDGGSRRTLTLGPWGSEKAQQDVMSPYALERLLELLVNPHQDTRKICLVSCGGRGPELQ
jgi:hypothetical protein